MRTFRVLFVFAAITATAAAAGLDFRGAAIVTGPNPNPRVSKAAAMIAEEIEKRTQLRLPVTAERRPGTPAILIALQPGGAAEGFTVTSAEGPVASVSGNDERGVIFGAGYLLRRFHMGRQKLELEPQIRVSSSPVTPIRGHQLGFRPKTNSYDAWTVAMWEQYIRELAIFGTNTVELIPPRSDDDPDSPHFPLTQIDMMAEMSRIAGEYAMDVSIWYPAMDKDYSDPKTVEFALREWGEVFRRLPRIDAVFVPGGDPGHTQPVHLFALLEKQTANLKRHHPKAQMWMSPQSFGKEWMDEFYGLMDRQPGWLSGIVFGPQAIHSLPRVRERVSKRYPVRFYPDITHSMHAQFPAQNWDWAYAVTEGREGINPRPVSQAAIFRKYNPYTTGFVTYSEGCNDDVNKFVWSGLGWNPKAAVKELLNDYTRFFFGPDVAEPVAQGVLALEQNWIGPLATNEGVDTTLAQFRDLEKRATPLLRLNWRFQQLLYRAYYDAFVRARLRSETEQEQRALGELARAPQSGSAAAMDAAEAILDSDPLTASARALRARVFELAEGLYQSIRMQLSVPRYQAIGVRRGANLDGIDLALNNRNWLKDRFAAVRALKEEPARAAELHRILNWSNPGPGGFYDDLGQQGAQPHLVAGEPFESDPDFLRSPLIGFGARLPSNGWRTSWFSHAESLYDNALKLRYTDLDPAARYRLRVTYAGDQPRIQIGLVANSGIRIHDYIDKPSPMTPLEFDIPHEATRGGTLELAWNRTPGLGGSGRGCQVAEVWLIRIDK